MLDITLLLRGKPDKYYCSLLNRLLISLKIRYITGWYHSTTGEINIHLTNIYKKNRDVDKFAERLAINIAHETFHKVICDELKIRREVITPEAYCFEKVLDKLGIGHKLK